jgi:hypothetical protein
MAVVDQPPWSAPAACSIGPIPSSFVHPLEQQTKIRHDEFFTSAGEHLPEINVADLRPGADPQLQQEVVRKIGEACAQWGFFQVCNHGVPPELMARVERMVSCYCAVCFQEFAVEGDGALCTWSEYRLAQCLFWVLHAMS